jgi:hypothetical protein
MMNTLEAVNLVLRKMGEVPVTSVDEQYPTLSIILPSLEETRHAILAEGWWFNTYEGIRYTPDDDGLIAVPESVLMFYPDDPTKYTFSGASIVQAATGSPVITEVVTGRTIIDIEYEKLPQNAQKVIAFKAAVDTYVNDFGPDKTSDSIGADFAYWYGDLSSTHTRQRKSTSRTKRQYLRWRQALSN